MKPPFKVAAVEFNPEFMEFEKNIQGACAMAEEAAKNGAKLIVLPEAAISGYIYRDLEQFLPYMDTIPGKTTDALVKVASAYSCYIAIGIAEFFEFDQAYMRNHFVYSHQYLALNRSPQI